MFVIETEADARRVANLHATPSGALRFTTLSFTHRGRYTWGVGAARHMWQNLQELDSIGSTLLISYDLHTCQVLIENGIPCFVDRWLSQPKTLKGD